MRFGRRVGPKARPDAACEATWQLWEMVFVDVGHHALRGKFVHLTQRYRGHAKYVFT